MNTTTLTVPSQAQDYSPIIRLAVDGLASPRSKRAYGVALDRFLAWHTEQGRPVLSKALVQSYKAKLQADGLAPATVNLHLGAIRRLATEAADNGLLDPSTSAAIRRVKGIKAETVPAGREVTPGELAGLMRVCSDDPTPAGARDAAILGVLYVGGLRRSELAALDLADFDPGTGALTVRNGKGNR
jgi:integrase